MLKVKKLIAAVLTVAMLGTLCVPVTVAAEATAADRTITWLDLDFNDQQVVEKTATSAAAGFQIDVGTPTITQISDSDYGLTSTTDSWWLLMKLPGLVTTGKLTFEYSFVNSTNEYNYAFASPSLPTNETVNSGYAIKFAASTQTLSGTTYMYGFNDGLASAWESNMGTKTAVDGKNKVKIEIDYNTNTLTTFLNGEEIKSRSLTNVTALANGVGAFGIRDPKSSVFDDISIKWEYPESGVWFENNFDNISPSIHTNAVLNIGVSRAADKHVGTWGVGTHGSDAGLNFTGFTNGFYVVGLPKAISSDVVSYSFDFVSSGGATDSYVGVSVDQCTAAYNNVIDKYGAYIKDGVFYPPADTMSSTKNTAEAVTLDKTKKYTMVQSFDFENEKVTTTLIKEAETDPTFEESIDMPPGMAFASLKFVMNDGVPFFDNVKIEWDKEEEATDPEGPGGSSGEGSGGSSGEGSGGSSGEGSGEGSGGSSGGSSGEGSGEGSGGSSGEGSGGSSGEGSGEGSGGNSGIVEKIYYKNNFDNGPTSTPEALYEGAAFGFENAGDYRRQAFHNGESGVTADGYTAIWYAMVKLPELVNTGVLTYSFDFVKDDNSGGSTVNLAKAVPTGANYTAFNTATMFENIFIWKDNIYGPLNNFANGGDIGNQKTVNPNELYSVKQVVDYNGGKVYTYVNGTLLPSGEKTITSANGIGGIRFAFQPSVKFFDNIEVKWSERGTLSVEDVYANGNKILIEFSDTVSANNFPSNGFVVTNAITGERYNVSAVQKGMIVELSGTDLTIADGDVYAVSLPELEGVLGGKTNTSTCIMTSDSGKYLTDIVLTDCYGETNNYSLANVSPYTKDIKLSFTDSAAAAAAGVEVLKDNVPVGFVKTVTGKDASVKLDKYMLGGSNYTINITGLDKPYSIGFTTAAGGAEIVKCEFKDGSGTPITSLSGVTAVDAKLTVVKTVPGAKTYKASYALFNNTELSGYNRQDVVFTESQDEVICTFEDIPVSDNSNAMLKIFMSNSLTDIQSLGKVYSVSNNYAKVKDNETITISGETGRIGEGVAIEVYKGELTDNVNAGTITTPYLNKIVLKDYAVTDENGSYSFDFNIDADNANLGSGTYSVYTAVGGGAVQLAEIEVLTKTDYEDGIDALTNKATLTASDITTYATVLGFSDAELTGVNLASLARLLKNTINEEPLSKSDRSLTANIAKRVLFVENLMNDKITDIYSQDLSITQLDDGDIEDWYDKNYITANLKTDFAARLAAGEYESYSDYKAALAEAFILATVRYPNGNSNAGAVITEFATEIGIDISKGNFNVWAALAGNNYTDLNTLKTAYNTAAEGQPVTGGGSTGGGGGSAGGGGGSFGSVTVGGAGVTGDSGNVNGSTVSAIPMNIFADVTDSHWAKVAIVAMAERNIITGDGNGSFRPDDDIARSEFCKIVVVAFDSEAELANIDFKDVAENSWYYPYVRKAYSAGITKGIGNGLFAPESKITREDMAVMIYNAALAYGKVFDTQSAVDFEDSGSISDYAREAVAALCNAGAINGYEGNVFMPKNTATRAEAAKIIFSLISM